MSEMVKDMNAFFISLTISFVVSIVVTFVLMPWVMRTMRKKGIVGKDKNKKKKPTLPEMGGVGVLIGYLSGLFAYLMVSEKVFHQSLPWPIVVICGMFCVLGIALLGIIDDLFDMRQRVKAFLPMFFAIPLALYAVNMSGTGINLFHRAYVDIGWFMFFLILFAVSAASNGANMLEGYNGLGAGLAIIISSFLCIVAVWQERPLTLFFLVPLIGASIAFLWFNNYPAKVFPGDTYTLFYGSVIAVAVIVGPVKEIGAFLFIPMIIEFFLKLTSKFQAENFAKLDEFGHLKYHGPIQSLTHLMIKMFRVDERTLVWRLWALELLICVMTVPLMFR